MRKLLLALALGVAACQAQPGNTEKQAAASNPNCHGEWRSAGTIRYGQNAEVAMNLKNTGERCWWGVGIGGTVTAGTHLTDAPSHGDTILRTPPGAVLLGYLPMPGYVGPDHFVVVLPAEGYETRLDVSVHVRE